MLAAMRRVVRGKTSRVWVVRSLGLLMAAYGALRMSIEPGFGWHWRGGYVSGQLPMLLGLAITVGAPWLVPRRASRRRARVAKAGAREYDAVRA